MCVYEIYNYMYICMRGCISRNNIVVASDVNGRRRLSDCRKEIKTFCNN